MIRFFGKDKSALPITDGGSSIDGGRWKQILKKNVATYAPDKNHPRLQSIDAFPDSYGQTSNALYLGMTNWKVFKLIF